VVVFGPAHSAEGLGLATEGKPSGSEAGWTAAAARAATDCRPPRTAHASGKPVGDCRQHVAGAGGRKLDEARGAQARRPSGAAITVSGPGDHDHAARLPVRGASTCSAPSQSNACSSSHRSAFSSGTASAKKRGISSTSASARERRDRGDIPAFCARLAPGQGRVSRSGGVASMVKHIGKRAHQQDRRHGRRFGNSFT
jgi:hypothetical protein